jgi:hypothetical protein
MPRRSLFLTLALAIFAVVAMPAHAAINSSVTIQRDDSTNPNSMTGKVDSPKASCKKNRKVKLFWDEGDGFEVVAGDRTSDRGRWRSFYTLASMRGGAPIPPGAYKAKVTKKRLGDGRTCGSAVSATITVSGT